MTYLRDGNVLRFLSGNPRGGDLAARLEDGVHKALSNKRLLVLLIDTFLVTSALEGHDRKVTTITSVKD